MSAPTHMRREIAEIPEAAARLIDASDGALAAAAARLRAIEPRFLTTVARGSSDHAATFFKYAVEITAGIPVASLGPSIASIYGASLKLKDSACIAVSQSGKSPDIVAMAEAAGKGGALTIALTNTGGSPLAAACDHPVDILAGPEKSVAATKTFVNSALAGLLLLARWTGDDMLLAAIRSLPEGLARGIDCDWTALAETLSNEQSLFVLGRGPGIAIASEAALKFKETSSLHAEAYSAAEVMHGPLALVGPGFPVLALAVGDASEQSIADTADRLAEKRAPAFVTSTRARLARPLPYAATGHELTEPLSRIVSFYAFIEAFARHRGLDPDQPRNLRKVTETL